MLKDRLRRLIYRPIYNFQYFLNHKNFEDLQVMCLPIGFIGCANQILASALTAHHNIVMTNQLDLLESWWKNLAFYGESVAMKMLLLDIHKLDREICSGKTVYMQESYKTYPIPDQWQGRCERLTVIGDSSLAVNLKVLMKKAYKDKKGKCMGLEALKASSNVALKFIFFIRNPYDLITSNVMHLSKGKEQKEIFDTAIHKLIVCCERHKTLLANVDQEQVFTWRFEDIAVSPREKLSDLCKFLGIRTDTPKSYLNVCSKILPKNQNKIRLKIEWPEEQKAQVADAIKKYEFLSGYSWDS